MNEAALSMRPNSPAAPAAARRLLLRWWGWLWLSTTVFGILIAMRYYTVVDLDSRPLALGFRTAMLIAHFGALIGLLLAPVMLLSRLAPRAALIIPLGVISSVLLLAVLLVDTQVYLLYRFHINVGVLNLLFGGAASETFVFSRAMYAQAAAIALAIIAVQSFAAWFWWRHVRTQQEHRVFARAIAWTFVFAVLGFHLPHIWADAVGFEPFVEQTDVLPARYAATAKRTLRKLGVTVRSEPLLAGGPGADGLKYPLHPMACKAPEKQPNIVVIMIDSWRFDALTPRATPNIDAFARTSTRFMDHYSGGNATRIGVFSLFYSIPGTYWHRMLAARQGPVLIDELLRRDYEMGVFRSAPLFSPEFDRTVFAQVQPERMRSDGERPADWDRDLTNDFLAFLDSRTSPAPFFAFLFYDSPHKFDIPDNAALPFQPSAEQPNYFTLRDPALKESMFNRYLNSVHYVDSLVGEALDALEAHDLIDDSIIVITGDHGQEFDDAGQGYWGHASNFTRYQTKVPFVMHTPDKPASVQKHRTTHFDVVPTLMRQYLGCTSLAPANYSVGRSLFESGGREMLLMSEYMDFAIVQPDVIAVVRKHGMNILSPKYEELEGAVLDPEAVKAALEQKSRFFEAAGTRRR